MVIHAPIRVTAAARTMKPRGASFAESLRLPKTPANKIAKFGILTKGSELQEEALESFLRMR
jgi:hypothetical protein